MMKFIVLFALVAVAYAAPSPLVATPLLARTEPQPEAPADTEHASHVAATIPVHTIAYSAPLIDHAPITHIPFGYGGEYLAYSSPYEAHDYRISY